MSRRSSVVLGKAAKAQPAPIENKGESKTGAPERSHLAPLLLLFAASGCAALIYEIVWFQLLQLVIGSSAVSLGLLLAAYMGGLCLGSAAFARLVPAWRDPMRVYALLELGIAAFGIIALFGVPLVGRMYVAGATSGLTGLVLRGVVAACCLLPPTLLMGASLPAIARSVESTPKGVSRLGFLYSANVAGAVLGCLLAGFYLLRVYNMGGGDVHRCRDQPGGCRGARSCWRAIMQREPSGSDTEPNPVQLTPRRAPSAVLIYVAIGLSGMSALGAEVVWTRLLSLLLGATVYTFSIILGVFLLGLWAGSSIGSLLVRSAQRVLRQPRVALAVCQILLAAAIAWTAFTLAHVLPYWPVDPWLSINPVVQFRSGFHALPAHHFSGHAAVGRQFPAGIGWRSGGGRGSGAAFGIRIRRQYGGIHSGRAGVQPGADSIHRDPGEPRVLDLAGGCRRRRSRWCRRRLQCGNRSVLLRPSAPWRPRC